MSIVSRHHRAAARAVRLATWWSLASGSVLLSMAALTWWLWRAVANPWMTTPPWLWPLIIVLGPPSIVYFAVVRHLQLWWRIVMFYALAHAVAIGGLTVYLIWQQDWASVVVVPAAALIGGLLNVAMSARIAWDMLGMQRLGTRGFAVLPLTGEELGQDAGPLNVADRPTRAQLRAQRRADRNARRLALRPRRPYQRALRSLVLMAGLSLAIGLAAMFGDRYVRDAPRFHGGFVTSPALAWIIPALGFAISFVLMKRRARSGAILGMVTALFQAAIALAALIANLLARAPALVPVVLSALWFAALLELTIHLMQSMSIMRWLEEERKAFGGPHGAQCPAGVVEQMR